MMKGALVMIADPRPNSTATHSLTPSQTWAAPMMMSTTAPTKATTDDPAHLSSSNVFGWRADMSLSCPVVRGLWSRFGVLHSFQHGGRFDRRAWSHRQYVPDLQEPRSITLSGCGARHLWGSAALSP